MSLIEFLTDNNDELVTLNSAQITYVRNDSGTAIIKMSTNEQFIVESYDEVLSRLRESNVEVHLDKEARDNAQEAAALEEDNEE